MTKVGPTGDFPQGKFTEDDEGALNIGIATHDGKVVIDFGQPVAWVGMDPDLAMEVARAIAKHAGRIKGVTVSLTFGDET